MRVHEIKSFLPQVHYLRAQLHEVQEDHERRDLFMNTVVDMIDVNPRHVVRRLKNDGDNDGEIDGDGDDEVCPSHIVLFTLVHISFFTVCPR